jgi:hypothetical protein
MLQFYWGIDFLLQVRTDNTYNQICILLILLIISFKGTSQVSGTVINIHDEPIESVQVISIKTKSGTTSNWKGEFFINVGINDVLTFSHINYEPFYLNVSDSIPDVIILKERNNTIDEIKVASFNTTDIQYIDNKSIDRVPVLLGEKDVLKYIATLPGVVTTSALEAGIYVRGGNSSHNAYMVNKISVADPKHISGILSTFDPFILSSSKIYKSGYPSDYNGFLSSYINMQPSKQCLHRYTGEASFGLISSSLKSKLALGEKKQTIAALSVRKSYFQYLAKAINRNNNNLIPEYSFNDITLSVSSNINENWKLSAFGLSTSDNLPLSVGSNTNHNFNWGSKSGVISILGLINPKNRIEFGIGANHYLANTTTSSLLNTQYKSNIGHYTLSAKVTHYAGEKLEIIAGLTNELNRLDYTQQFDEQTDNFYSKYYLTKANSEIKYRINNLTNITIGANVSVLDGQWQSVYVAPRLKLLHRKRNTGFWIDFARTNQFEEVLPAFTIKSPVDLKFTIYDNLSPAISDQISMGMSKLSNNQLKFNSGVFYKKFTNIKDFMAANRTNLANISNSMISGSGYAYGLEFDAIYSSSNNYIRVNYTLSEVTHKFEQINNGAIFNPPYDTRHNIMANTSIKLSKSISFDALWTFNSGVTTTVPIGVAVTKNITNNENAFKYIPVYNERYNYRLPNKHQLDISLNYSKYYSLNELRFSFGIFNAYNKSNPSFIYIEPEMKDDYFIKFIPKSKVLLPFMPYVSLTYIVNRN